MEIDPEEKLYRAMANLTEEVPKIQGEIESLKKGFGKLSKNVKHNVEQLDLMGLQEQIVALDEKVNDVIQIVAKQTSSLDGMLPLFKELTIAVEHNKLMSIFHDMLGILESSNIPDKHAIHTQLIADVTNAKQQIRTWPHKSSLVEDCRQTWAKRLSDLGCTFYEF